MKFDKLVGIIGWPVSHSLSPAMHNRAFLSLGLEGWCYVAMPVASEPISRVKDAVFGLRALQYRGANVTVPHKETVVPYMDRLSKTARAIGAVNTIVIDQQGQLVGHNTDALGFTNDLHDHQIDVKNMHVLVLGAGGSAKAVVYGLLSQGCKNISVENRTKSKARDLVQPFRHQFKDAKLNIDVSIDDKKQAHLVVNTTSLGMSDTREQMPWDQNLVFKSEQIVYDLIYNPPTTTFLAFAKKNKAKAINGLGMLVHQGALSFTLWTGQNAPIAAMKSAAEEALLQRDFF